MVPKIVKKSMSGSLGKCKLKQSTQIFEILSQNGPNMGPKWVPKSSKKLIPEPLGSLLDPKMVPN